MLIPKKVLWVRQAWEQCRPLKPSLNRSHLSITSFTQALIPYNNTPLTFEGRVPVREMEILIFWSRTGPQYTSINYLFWPLFNFQFSKSSHPVLFFKVIVGLMFSCLEIFRWKSPYSSSEVQTSVWPLKPCGCFSCTSLSPLLVFNGGGSSCCLSQLLLLCLLVAENAETTLYIFIDSFRQAETFNEKAVSDISWSNFRFQFMRHKKGCKGMFCPSRRHIHWFLINHWCWFQHCV